jgi:hypothetical protein
VLRIQVPAVWTGRTDMISVKRNQIWIKMRKLNPKAAMELRDFALEMSIEGFQREVFPYISAKT